LADRTVSVALQLKIQGFTSALRTAQNQASKFADDVSTKARKNKQSLDTMARGFAAVGVAAGAGVGLAVKRFADFDKAMSNVKAATHESAANMALLRQAAIDAGAKTAFSATEAAGAIENLSKAGVSTNDILRGGLNGALALAAAGELDVADAGEIAATAMTQFHLAGKDIPHVADLLAAGAGKAQGEVSDLAMALKQGGLVASQAGLSIEETTGTLAAFAAAGLIGSDAGTSLRTMLLRLMNPSGEAADLMEELGIHAYDASGAFIGMAPLAEQLRTKLGKLSQEQRDAALATIFGSDAIRGANVLYAGGAKGIADWTAKVNDAGYAAETAAAKQDNLRGDIEKLGGSLDTALIQSGEGANDVLRALVQGAEDAVNAFSELPDWVQKGALALAGLVGAGGLGAAGLIKAVQAASELRGALQKLGAVSNGLKFGLGGIGLALTAATVVFGAFAKETAESKQKVQELRDTLDQATGAITGNTRAYVANDLAQSGLAQKAKDLGLNLSTVTDAALGNKGALDGLVTQLTAVADANIIAGSGVQSGVVRYNEQGQAAKDLIKELTGMNTRLTDAQGKQKLAAEGAQEHKTAQQLAADAVKKSNESFREQTQTLDELITAMHRASGLALGLSESEIKYKDTLATALKPLKAKEKGLNLNTEAGRKNQSALNDLAKAANDQTDAMLKSGKANIDVAKTAEQSRKDFVRAAVQMGVNKQRAEAMARSLIDIPNVTREAKLNANKKDLDTKLAAAQKALKDPNLTKERRAKLNADIAALQAKLAQAQAQIDALHGKNIPITYTMNGTNWTLNTKTTSRVGGLASGGRVRGPGSDTSDTAGIFALSNNEYVVKAASARKYGDKAMASVNSGTATIIPGMARGGAVSIDGTGVFKDAAQLRAVLGQGFGGPALQFARSQVGKPYVWGAAGPGGYDCSGFLSAIVNVIQGRSPYGRRFSTGTLPAGLFTPGPGMFSIGWFRGSPGHTAGTLGGVNVESRGGEGVVVGPRARGATDPLFDSGVYHLRGYAKGGAVRAKDGDPPFDSYDPRGKHYRGTDLVTAMKRGVLIRDRGGILPTGTSIVQNNTGRSEYVLPSFAGGGAVDATRYSTATVPVTTRASGAAGRDTLRRSDLQGLRIQLDAPGIGTLTGHIRLTARDEIDAASEFAATTGRMR
jgi:TP901 family phage tail tape measure protein